MSGERFGVLIVRHVNVCRSPMAERPDGTAIAEGAAEFEVINAVPVPGPTIRCTP